MSETGTFKAVWNTGGLISAMIISVLSCVSIASAAEFTTADICKAGVAAEFRKDPEIIIIDREKNGLVYLSYVRPSDKTTWEFMCKLEDNKIIWAVPPDGRWRNTKDDMSIIYKVLDDNVVVDCKYSDSSGYTNIYSVAQLKGIEEPFSLSRVAYIQANDNRLFVYEFTGQVTDARMMDYLTMRPPMNTPGKMTVAYYFHKGTAPPRDSFKNSVSVIDADLTLYDNPKIAQWNYTYKVYPKGNRKMVNCQDRSSDDLCKP